MSRLTIAKRINLKGYLCVGYTLLKVLGAIPTIVLERLICEYYYAYRYGLLFTDDYCYIDLVELSYHLGFSTDDIEQAVIKLYELGLVDLSKINNHFAVKIKEDEIVDFEKTAEVENKFKNWDYGLYTMLNED